MHFDLRFWEELLTPGEIVEKALPFLTEFSASVAVAMHPASLTRKNANAFKKLKEAGIEFAFWPLMEKERGYWPCERNISTYAELVRNQLEWAERNGILPDMVAVDLEMSLLQVQKIMSATSPVKKLRVALSQVWDNLDRERYYKARGRLSELNDEIQDRGIRTLAAVLPWVGLELEWDVELIQDMVETPVAGISWDVISPTVYVSMIAAMSGGTITRRDANWLVYENCGMLRSKYGGRAGISLGVTGVGVLEDEPTFDSPVDLAVGLEAALAAGVRDISIFSLEGIISRPDPREWFEAIKAATPRVPERSRKIAGGLTAARCVYPHVARLVDWYRRV
ncbi:MAG: hypothetical protein CVT63_00615 [Candidatus Anoxymicrobium japonicum]|uniref:Uncharacterized protein n=1 Tax=Candidatus Anoxymicrobium japonicum TaxID=2013648 RepID=A0A2N3G857_9ACTN|nr:MAG: hypothetical protein CVT63_00615 [Candidatus Anoxymicrobium japonicum]